MTDDNPTLVDVPDGVNGYVVEAAATRIELVMAAVYHHCHEHRENSCSCKPQLSRSRGTIYSECLKSTQH
jgi:hypothetical protein